MALSKTHFQIQSFFHNFSNPLLIYYQLKQKNGYLKIGLGVATVVSKQDQFGLDPNNNNNNTVGAA
jgi:hypothetical protein